MRTLKHALMAAAALSAGLALTVPAANAAPDEIGPNVNQSVGPRTTAQMTPTPTYARGATRAQMDAREREITRHLNEQQLSRQQAMQPMPLPTQGRAPQEAMQPLPVGPQGDSMQYPNEHEDY